MNSPRNLKGTVLKDTYRLKKVIGHGGMAVVYEASHVHLPRRYAIKLFSPSLASSEMLMKRFQREATVTCRLGHPNIVEVSDFGHDPDVGPYIVMELLEGENLSRRLARVKRLSPDEALAVVEQVCSALTLAHAGDVVHRDLKPGNIYLCRGAGDAELAKLLDFGISQVPDSALTQTNARLGSARYMSPEQAQAHQMDHRTDIFSMGSIIFYMLAGEPPYSGKDELVVMYQIVHEEPRDLRTFRPDLSRELERVVARALARDPDKRYQSAEELSEAFARAVAGQAQATALAEAATDPGAAAGDAAADSPTEDRSPVVDVMGQTLPPDSEAKKQTVMEVPSPVVDARKQTLMEPRGVVDAAARRETVKERATAVDRQARTLMEPPTDETAVDTLKEKILQVAADVDARAETLRDRTPEVDPNKITLMDPVSADEVSAHMETVRDEPALPRVDPQRETVKEEILEVNSAELSALDPVESTESVGQQRRSPALVVGLAVLLAAGAVGAIMVLSRGGPGPAAAPVVAPAPPAVQPPGSRSEASEARPVAKAAPPAAPAPDIAPPPAAPAPRTAARPTGGAGLVVSRPKKPRRPLRSKRRPRPAKAPPKAPPKTPAEAPFSGDL